MRSIGLRASPTSSPSAAGMYTAAKGPTPAVFQARCAQSAAPSGAFAGGVPLNINLFDPSLTSVTLTLSGSGHGNGHGTFHAPIPDDPSLVGLTLYGQWWVEDPGAVNGFATSNGLQLIVF